MVALLKSAAKLPLCPDLRSMNWVLRFRSETGSIRLPAAVLLCPPRRFRELRSVELPLSPGAFRPPECWCCRGATETCLHAWSGHAVTWQPYWDWA